jgi:hypothetical protein
MINIFILTYAIITMWVFSYLLGEKPYIKGRSFLLSQILIVTHSLATSLIWPFYMFVLIYDKLSERKNETN